MHWDDSQTIINIHGSPLEFFKSIPKSQMINKIKNISQFCVEFPSLMLKCASNKVYCHGFVIFSGLGHRSEVVGRFEISMTALECKRLVDLTIRFLRSGVAGNYGLFRKLSN